MIKQLRLGKKRWLCSLVFLLPGLLMAQEKAGPQVHYPVSEHRFFTGPEQYFTGTAEVEVLFPANDTAEYSGAYVTFAAAARSAWHAHPAGQHILVISGTARTGTRDGKVLEFGPGEAVWCPPGIDHWHGATPDAEMKHLVLTGVKDGENVVWKEKVSDADYSTPATTVHHSD